MIIRRDTLRKMVEEGNMEAQKFNPGNGFACSNWLPARIINTHDDFKIGYRNLDKQDFESRFGSATKNSDGSYTLNIHYNEWYTFKKR